MSVVKMIGIILLAVFLILSGLITVSAIHLSEPARYLIDLIELAAGVLILISIGRFFPKKDA